MIVHDWGENLEAEGRLAPASASAPAVGGIHQHALLLRGMLASAYDLDGVSRVVAFHIRPRPKVS